jgi:2-phospho-L-lactate guanylyltransferase
VNVLVVRDNSFAVNFHGGSFRDHRDMAHENELEAVESGSWRLAVDIDEPRDLVEVLVHSTGRVGAWLV